MAVSRLDIVHRVFGSSFSISRWFLLLHDGIDLAAKEGTPVYAVAAGTVEYARDARLQSDRGARGWAMGGGNVVNVNIGSRKAAQYAHLKSFVVKEGDKVARGQLIGYVGRTGGKTSTGAFGGAGAQFVGPHLHFGIWNHATNRMENPTAYLTGLGTVTPAVKSAYLTFWNTVTFRRDKVLDAKDVHNIISQLENAGFFGEQSPWNLVGGISEEITRGVLTRHIGEKWNEQLAAKLAVEMGVSAMEATAVPKALDPTGGALVTIAESIGKLSDPGNWLRIIALFGGIGLATFGGYQILRSTGVPGIPVRAGSFGA